MNVAFNVVANCFPLMLIVMLLLYALVCCFSLMFLSVHLSSKTVLFSLLSSDNVYTDGDYVKHCFFPLSFTVVFWFLNYLYFILFLWYVDLRNRFHWFWKTCQFLFQLIAFIDCCLCTPPSQLVYLWMKSLAPFMTFLNSCLQGSLRTVLCLCFKIIIYFDYPLWIGVSSTASSCSFVAILSWFMPSHFMQILV